MSHKLVQIVTPAYNEATVLERLVAKLRAVMAPLAPRYAYQIIIVVDRSTDDTFAVARALAAEGDDVRVVHLSRRFGHQLALKAGLDHADADAVIMMDSDLQHPPELIPTLLEHFEAGCNIVFTQRSGSQQSLLKDVFSRGFYRLMNRISRTRLIPASSDFRLIDRKVLAVFRGMNEYDPFLRGMFPWLGFRSEIVPYEVAARAGGKSKYTHKDSLRLAISGVTSFSTFPLEVGIFLGIGSLGISALLFVCFIGWVALRGAVHWELLQVLLIIFFGSVQIFLIGIIGEYVGRTFLAQKNRPLYVVDECVGFPAQGPPRPPEEQS